LTPVNASIYVVTLNSLEGCMCATWSLASQHNSYWNNCDHCCHSNPAGSNCPGSHPISVSTSQLFNDGIYLTQM